MKNRNKALAAMHLLRERMPRLCDAGELIMGFDGKFTRSYISEKLSVSESQASYLIKKLQSVACFVFVITTFESNDAWLYELVDCTFCNKEYLLSLDRHSMEIEDKNRGGAVVEKYPYKLSSAWKLALGIKQVKLR